MSAQSLISNGSVRVSQVIGSVRFLTDSSGTITDTWNFDAFGVLLSRTGTTANNYLYRGEQFDPDLGMYSLRARFYNQSTGRFWNQDSYEGSTSDPASLHKYLYANADPVSNWDSSGHDIDPTDFWLDGFLVHRAIGLHFIGEGVALDHERVANYIPVSSILNRDEGRSKNSLDRLIAKGDLGSKPDLVDLDTHEVWEIKTTRGYAIGVLDFEVDPKNWTGGMVKSKTNPVPCRRNVVCIAPSSKPRSGSRP